MRFSSFLRALAATSAFACVALTSFGPGNTLTLGRDVEAAPIGTATLKSKDSEEVSKAWRLFITLKLPKPPFPAHQSMRFVFTKTAAFERSLVDGKSEPVTTRTALTGQVPKSESLDVNFGDATGKIYNQTNFNFMVSRDQGYEAGEYTLQVRTSDGVDVGGKMNVTLKGENEVVDRRSIAFNAKDKSVKKVDDGVEKEKKEKEAIANSVSGDVQASGTAEPFVSPDAYNKTPEEELKVRKSGGCGCNTSRSASEHGLTILLGLGTLALVRRSRRRA
jgi:MYXO-CTERM domain-containing protein